MLKVPSNNSTANGVACALGAWFLFSLGDAGMKFLSESYALHQIVLIRSVVALAITLAIIMPLEGGYKLIRTSRPGVHLLRGLCVTVANFLFFAGLASIALAEASAIFFVAPLFITTLSVFVLKENVGRHRWLAIAIGMIGVLVMLRPGTSAFQYAALLPLFAAFAYACMQILTRQLGLKEKASTMAFYIQIVFLIVSTTFGLLFSDGRYANPNNATMDFLFRAWVIPEARDLIIMIGLGFIVGIGGYLVSQAYRLCEAATIAPFEYLALVLAVIWGVSIWGDWPDAFGWTGILLILGSGLYVFWREVVLDRKFVIKHPMPRNR